MGVYTTPVDNLPAGLAVECRYRQNRIGTRNAALSAIETEPAVGLAVLFFRITFSTLVMIGLGTTRTPNQGVVVDARARNTNRTGINRLQLIFVLRA